MTNETTARPRFDLTINLGHVVILCAALFGFVGSLYVGAYRQTAIEEKVTSIERKLDAFSALLISAAVTEQKMKELERRLDLAERAR